MQLRPATANDFDAILALNEESVHYLSALDRDRLVALDQACARHSVIQRHGLVVAFMLVFREGATYDSVNYRWFDEHYDRFLYIDRIVVSTKIHAKGAGSLLYEDLFSVARATAVPTLTCEIDIEPPNVVSARFHAKLGFQEIGRQAVAGGKKTVSLQVLNVG